MCYLHRWTLQYHLVCTKGFGTPQLFLWRISALEAFLLGPFDTLLIILFNNQPSSPDFCFLETAVLEHVLIVFCGHHPAIWNVSQFFEENSDVEEHVMHELYKCYGHLNPPFSGSEVYERSQFLNNLIHGWGLIGCCISPFGWYRWILLKEHIVTIHEVITYFRWRRLMYDRQRIVSLGWRSWKFSNRHFARCRPNVNLEVLVEMHMEALQLHKICKDGS